MSYFANCTATVTRSQGNRTPAGYEETGTTTVLSCRADYQASGRRLERLQQVHETGDAVLFLEKDSANAEPGDSITVDHDDGRQLEGSVEEVISIDDSLLIGLS
jgi:hypothetical protein